MPPGGDQPQDSGHHLGCEHVLLGAREEIPQRLWRGEGEDLCDGVPDGGGAAREPCRDRGIRHPLPSRARERTVHPSVGAQGGEHRHGEELPVTVQCHQRHGGKVQHADTLLVSPSFTEAP